MFTNMRAWLATRRWLARKEEGASLVEYALLVALIALVCVVGIGFLGQNINSMFNAIANYIKGIPIP